MFHVRLRLRECLKFDLLHAPQHEQKKKQNKTKNKLLLKILGTHKIRFDSNQCSIFRYFDINECNKYFYYRVSAIKLTSCQSQLNLLICSESLKQKCKYGSSVTRAQTVRLNISQFVNQCEHFLGHLQHCFTISYRRENQRHYELKAASESDCNAWIGAIREAR